MRKKILLSILFVMILFAWGFSSVKNINLIAALKGYFYQEPVEVKQYGTVKYNQKKAQSGYTLVSSRAIGESVDFQTSEIINMQGEIVHQWKTDFDYTNHENKPDRDHLFSRLLPNGDLLVMSYEKGLARIDWDSNVLWNHDGFFHHDVRFTDDFIYTLKWENNFVEYGEHVLPIMDEILVTLDHDGNIISEVSLFQTFQHLLPDEAYENILELLYEEEIYELMQERPKDYYLKSNLAWDIFHMNALYHIDSDTDLFKKGQFLVSMRSINTIAVFDPQTLEVVWEYTGDIIRQHNPTLTPGGNVLVYDNGGVEELSTSIVDGKEVSRNARRKRTQIVEIDPHSKKVVWEYPKKSKKGFFAPIMGSAQRLENGNTLLINSVKGIIYEVTKKRKIVWEHHQREDGMNHYRAYRLSPQEAAMVDALLQNPDTADTE